MFNFEKEDIAELEEYLMMTGEDREEVLKHWDKFQKHPDKLVTPFMVWMELEKINGKTL